MKTKLFFLIIIMFFSSCLREKKGSLSINHIKNNVEIIYNDTTIFKDIDYKKMARDSLANSDIYHLNDSVLYFYNYFGGVNKISLYNNFKVLNKKLPYYYSPSKGVNNKIIEVNDKIILSNNLFIVIYDENLNEEFLVKDYVSFFDNSKYEQILESNFSLNKNDLTYNIKYLDSNFTSKDTTFNFNLGNLPNMNNRK